MRTQCEYRFVFECIVLHSHQLVAQPFGVFFFFASCFLHCRAHPQLVKLMEANGHITDEAMWDVLTELGMEMQAYSLRVQHDKVTSTTHISRRRAVILSNPGFLAQLQQQRAAKEGAIAVLLMPRRRRRFPSSRDLRSR